MVLLHNGLGCQRIGARVEEFANGDNPEVAPGIARSSEIAHRRLHQHLLAVHPCRYVVFGSDEKSSRFWLSLQVKVKTKIMFAWRRIGQCVVISRPYPLRS